MPVEDRLLLYTVILGAGFGLFTLVRRRAFSFWLHCALLATLIALSGSALFLHFTDRIDPATLSRYAESLLAGFTVFALLPSVALMVARKMASRRRSGWAAFLASSASALLGFPVPIRREAQFYAALAAAERGDEAECARRLRVLAELDALPAGSGGPLLAEVLPLAGARRWDDALAALEGKVLQGAVLRVIEVRAAAETGDLARALAAYRELDARVDPSAAVRNQARRAILACAGRTRFLREAQANGLPVMDGSPGDADLTLARSLEAEGRLSEALLHYQRAARRVHGRFERDALEGVTRCEGGRPRLAVGVGLDLDELLDIEESCRAERPEPEAVRHRIAASVSVWIVGLTTVMTLVAWQIAEQFAGGDYEGYLATGALSAPLILQDGEWWRLFTTMWLHGGVVHLLMNMGSILVVGIPLERRIGAARTLIVYVVSGVVASLGSVLINGTPVGVGASGAAMGLFGAFAAVLLLRPATFGAAERTRWLNVLWVTTLATAVVGGLEHQAIDNAAHGIGLLAGALTGWVLLLRRGRAGAGIGLTALLLVLAQAVATVAQARTAPEWLTTSWSRGAGLDVVHPSWLSVRETGAGLVFRREPVPFRVQLGRVGVHEPVPGLLFGDDETALVEALQQPPSVTEPGPVRLGRRTVTTTVALHPVVAAGAKDRFVELRVLRLGDVFALVAVPIPPDAPPEQVWGEIAPIALRLLASARPVR